MSAWGTRRQLSFVLVFVLLLILALVIIIAVNQRGPTCNDAMANQAELGVDCGGPCVKVCPLEASEPVVLWSRVFKVREGMYDVAAYIENPNPFGVIAAKYNVRIYDTDNIPVKDIKGQTYLNPNERVLVFIPLVDIGFRIPSRAFLSFPEPLDWKRLSEKLRKPSIVIRDQKILGQNGSLSLEAEVVNNSDFSSGSVELSAFLYDQSGNTAHVSLSSVPAINPSGSANVVFTWPNIEIDSVKSADIFPRVNLVDDNIIQNEDEL